MFLFLTNNTFAIRISIGNDPNFISYTEHVTSKRNAYQLFMPLVLSASFAISFSLHFWSAIRDY